MSRNFDNFIETFMEYSSFAQAPEKFLRWSAYSIIAGALERKVWLTNGGTTFYPNLYVMLIGDAGTRKSSSAHMAVELLRQVPDIKFMASRINEASFMESLLQAGMSKKFKFANEVFPHSAAYLYASEAATSFSAMYAGGGIVIALTDVFNCEPLGWSKTIGWDKHTLKNGITKVLNPCVNLLACSTPAWFTQTVMSKMDAEAGFGSRLLLVVQKERIRRDYGWTETTPTNNEIKMKLVEDLRHINRLQGPFSIDDSFREAYKIFDKHINDFICNEIISPLMTGYYERKLTHSTKLAMVIAASKRDDMLLTGHDLAEAWELVETLEQQMTLAYKAIEGGGGHGLADEIYSYYVKLPINDITKVSIVNKFKVKSGTKDIGKAIDALIRMGRLKYKLGGTALRETTYELVRATEPSPKGESRKSETEPHQD